MHKLGFVYLVGAGPGDPGLITLKAVECLKKADVVLYDRLIAKEILGYAKPNVVLRYVGKEKNASIDQQAINRLLLKYASKGKTVVRLKGGDPFVFGRGMEEMIFLKKNNVDCQVIPGVSSCYAVPEACGITLTQRGLASGFLVLTGHEDPSKKGKDVDWHHAAKFSGTIVIMMGLSNLKEITGKLIKFGLDAVTPAALISQGTTSQQAIVVGTLRDIADKASSFKAPAVCVIGEVLKVRFPLAGKRYLLTASNALNEEAAAKLKDLGASVVCLPMVRVMPNKNTLELDKIIADIKSFDWLVFTSRHGVYYFFERYFVKGLAKSGLKGRIACVGSGTAAELLKCGIKADLIPDKFTTKDLAQALTQKGIAGKNIVLLRTKVERDYLTQGLAGARAKVTDCNVYNVEEVAQKAPLSKVFAEKLDGIFFLSPKATQVFFNLLPEKISNRIKQRDSFYSIGPVTTQALQAQGAKNIETAKEYTVEGLIGTATYFQPENRSLSLFKR